MNTAGGGGGGGGIHPTEFLLEFSLLILQSGVGQNLVGQNGCSHYEMLHLRLTIYSFKEHFKGFLTGHLPWPSILEHRWSRVDAQILGSSYMSYFHDT